MLATQPAVTFVTEFRVICVFTMSICFVSLKFVCKIFSSAIHGYLGKKGKIGEGGAPFIAILNLT